MTYYKIDYNKKNFDLILKSIFDYWNYKNYEIFKKLYIQYLDSGKLVFYHYDVYGFWALFLDNDKLFITDFFIYEKYRKKGYGTKMLKYAIKEAQKINKQIYLKTSFSLSKFYIKNGFHIEEINDDIYTLKLNYNYYFILKLSFSVALVLGLYILILF